jgi:hypothetical protein
MGAVQLVRLALPLIVFSFRPKYTPRAVTSLFRSPLLLSRSLLTMNVLLPLFVAWMVAQFALRPAVRYFAAAVSVFCAQSGSAWHGSTAIVARFSDG